MCNLCPRNHRINRINRINRTNQSHQRTWPVQTEKALRSGSLRSLLDAFRFLLAKKVERVSLRFREGKKRAVKDIHKASKANKASKADRRGGHKKTAEGTGGKASAEDLAAAEKQAWNGLTPELLDCSRGHCYYVMSENFVAAVEAAGLSTWEYSK